MKPYTPGRRTSGSRTTASSGATANQVSGQMSKSAQLRNKEGTATAQMAARTSRGLVTIGGRGSFFCFLRWRRSMTSPSPPRLPFLLTRAPQRCAERGLVPLDLRAGRSGSLADARSRLGSDLQRAGEELERRRQSARRFAVDVEEDFGHA